MILPPPILFRDDRFVVLDKPAGLKAHPGPDGGPSVEDWFPHLSRRRDGPWLAHRLDRDTAGCLLVALRRAALHAAQAAFAERRVEKLYWAVARGGPPADSGRIAAPLRKANDGRAWRMVSDPSGAEACSDWRVLGRANGLCWFEVAPRTGRTHQVRAHLAALGCPILGDAEYGGADAGRDAAPLHLLARHLALPLSPPVRATAPVPPHMRATMQTFRNGPADPIGEPPIP